MSQWYYELLSEQFGPASEQEIHELIEVGTLSESDRVRHEESEQWMSVAEFTETHSNASFASDLSDLQFEFEESSAGSRTNQRAEVLAQRSALPEASGSSNDSPPPAQYYCQVLGQTLGPMELDDLTLLVTTGQLSRKDAVRLGDDGEWLAAVKLEELSAAFPEMTTRTVQSPEASVTQEKKAVPPPKTASSPDSKARTKPASPRQPQKRREEAVIDEMLNDVLMSDTDTKPAPRTTVSSLPSTPTERPEPTAPAAAVSTPQIPTSPVTPPVAASRPTAVVSSPPKSSPKRSIDVGELFSTLKKPLAGLVLIGAVVAGWMYFPMPGTTANVVTTEKCITRMQAVYAELETLDPVGNKTGLERLRRLINSEFGGYVAEMKNAGGDDAKTRCATALDEFLKFAKLESGSKREFDTQLRALKQAISPFGQSSSAGNPNAPGAAPNPGAAPK